ncbi:GNAT family N-acetyltransferase [Alkalihalobacillus sp. FSL W8-0930]
MSVRIKQLDTIQPYKSELCSLLIETVNQGASIGFHLPMHEEEARAFWNDYHPNEYRVTLGAFKEQRLIGTVSLELISKSNGSHRAEVCKLMVHPGARRLGAAKKLMIELENVAKQHNRSLLVLDTREGDPSNKLYISLGYEVAGTIPDFASNEKGELEATNLYYKLI